MATGNEDVVDDEEAAVVIKKKDDKKEDEPQEPRPSCSEIMKNKYADTKSHLYSKLPNRPTLPTIKRPEMPSLPTWQSVKSHIPEMPNLQISENVR